MPVPQRKIQPNFIPFKDFSQGIVDRTGIRTDNTAPSPLGSASINGTFKCAALPNGGLGPLPTFDKTLNYTDLGTTNLPVSTTAALTGFKIFGPTYARSSSGTIPRYIKNSVNPFELHLGFEYLDNTNQNQHWRKYPYHNLATAFDVHAVATAKSGTAQIFSPMSFVITRMFPSSPTTPGYPVIVGQWTLIADPPVASTDYCYVYPDPTSGVTIDTDTPFSMGSSFSGPAIGHQSRYVAFERGGDHHGAGNSTAFSNEFLIYTLPNSYTQDGGTVSIFGPENPSGYGAMGSLTASDLFAVKHYGGALLIQGDLNNPIVRRLPSVQSTGGIESLGISTPAGFVYAVNNDGVYAWTGGDSSVCLSPQLETNFWSIASNITTLFAGGFQYWAGGIYAPNNFVYLNGAWWRFEDPSVVQYYLYDIEPTNNRLYCAPPTFSDANGLLAHGYNQSTPANSYQWTSNPVSSLDRRVMRFRSVVVTSQGAGTIQISIIPSDGAGTNPDTVPSQPNTISPSTAGAQRVKLGMSGFATEFQLQIIATGQGGGPAPVIYEVDIETEEHTELVVS